MTMDVLVDCLCCGYSTLPERGGYDVCPVCFWEDEALDTSEPSGANHGLTLQEGRDNYARIGACAEGLERFCRRPNEWEIATRAARNGVRS